MTVARFTPEQRQARLEFLQRRQQGIGGSDLPAILGLSQYQDCLDVFHSKTRPIREEDVEDDTIHQLRGHYLEGTALAHYWLHTGRKGRAVKKPVSHPDYPAVSVSQDFEVFSDEARPEGFRGVGVGEIKCPVSSVYRKVHESGLRDSELVQLQTNIAARRAEWGTFCYFNMEDKDGPVLALDQVADVDMGAFLLAAGQRFWDEHVVPRVAPDPKAWRLLERTDAPKLVELSGEMVVLEKDGAFARKVGLMLDAKDTMSEAEEHYRTMQKDVLEALLAQQIGKAQIPGLARLTVVTKAGGKKLDADRLRNHVPLDRDLVEKWLREWQEGEPEVPHFTPEDVGRLLFECPLDLERFYVEGSPSQYLLPKRSSSED